MKFILCMFLDIVRIKNKKNDNDDDQIMNAQMTLHIHIEGFQILIWQSELVLETFRTPVVFSYHFVTFWKLVFK